LDHYSDKTKSTDVFLRLTSKDIGIIRATLSVERKEQPFGGICDQMNATKVCEFAISLYDFDLARSMPCKRCVDGAPDVVVDPFTGVGMAAEEDERRRRDEILGLWLPINQARAGSTVGVEDGGRIDAAKRVCQVAVGAGRDHAAEQGRGIAHMKKAAG